MRGLNPCRSRPRSRPRSWPAPWTNGPLQGSPDDPRPSQPERRSRTRTGPGSARPGERLRAGARPVLRTPRKKGCMGEAIITSRLPDRPAILPSAPARNAYARLCCQTFPWSQAKPERRAGSRRGTCARPRSGSQDEGPGKIWGDPFLAKELGAGSVRVPCTRPRPGAGPRLRSRSFADGYRARARPAIRDWSVLGRTAALRRREVPRPDREESGSCSTQNVLLRPRRRELDLG